ncbi:MAG: M14 family metallopeptidase, partial [Aquisalimonadaceae bacterium]
MTTRHPDPSTFDHGFREQYLDYTRLTRQMQAWADAYPDIVRLQSLGQTPEHRELWLLTVGPEPERVRPAVWVDGNMHAVELAGSSVALAIAEAAIRLHLNTGLEDLGIADAVLPELQEVLFHILPRISPDGAERVLRQGGMVRSVPRPMPGEKSAPYWEPEDLDGDGRCRFLRIADPGGDFVQSERHPGLMLPRRPDDPPPWYRLYPEGRIANWDGLTIPDPDFLAGTTDLNRNFPHDWQPEPEQTGAGPYPGSEPESIAVVRFAVDHPNLYAWLNLHTFGGVFIRPLGNKPDTDMNPADLAVYRQLAEWGRQHTGYPTVSGFEEFTYDPGKPLHGDLSDFAYHQRGCLSLVCELWDLFARLSMPEQHRFVDNYTAHGREEVERLAEWDAEHNKGRVFQGWRQIEHPQLGTVEVGGHDPLIGVWNPPPEALADVCAGLTRYWLQVARLLPRIVLEEVLVTRLAEGLVEVRATAANYGYLGTRGLPSAHHLPWNTPLYADLETRDCRLAHPERSHQQLGHLDGWGRGMGNGADLPWYQSSPGNGHRRTVRWLVHGEGTVTLRVGNARVGWIERTVNA